MIFWFGTMRGPGNGIATTNTEEGVGWVYELQGCVINPNPTMYNHFCNHMECSIEFLSLWTLTWVEVIRVVRKLHPGRQSASVRAWS